LNENKLLILGDGDLSFSAALAEEAINNSDCIGITASTLLSEDALKKTYKGAAANIEYLSGARPHLEKVNTRVLFELDATRLDILDDGASPFSAIIFNFPFADQEAAAHDRSDVQGKAVKEFDSQWLGVGRHQHLVSALFASAAHTAATERASIYISLLLSQAVTWEVERFAGEHGYKLAKVLPFEAPSSRYTRKRSYADATFVPLSPSSSPGSGQPPTRAIQVIDAWTFIFTPTGSQDRENMTRVTTTY